MLIITTCRGWGGVGGEQEAADVYIHRGEGQQAPN